MMNENHSINGSTEFSIHNSEFIINNTPAIRFKSFDGEWEEKKLGLNAEFLKGQGYSKNDLIAEGSPIVLYGRLYTKYKTTIFEVDTFVKNNGKSIVSKGSEVIVPASGETSEDIARASAVVQSGILLGGDLNVIYPHDKIYCVFLALTISNGKPKKDLSKRAQGKSVVHVRNADLKELEINFPDIAEQTKIGDYFQQLDTLIAQHQQKHDKLLSLKKALLEKMFPKQGATVPEIRFKGFSGDWEYKVLGDLSEIVRGASPRPIEDKKWFDEKSDVGWLRIKDVSEQDGRIYYLEQRISKAGEEKTRVLTEPHLLLSIAATVGKPVINYVSTGVHDGFLIFMKPVFDREFLFQWLKGFEREWKKYGQPGSQVNLNSEIVKRQNIAMPQDDEQIKIGNLFNQFDALINQHQAQLKKLNNIKQACMVKMFV
ncbi:restriction endonuclease subunit S [Iodobacter sp. CM08]|uniref:restriction endonuclease subunit S n=1 Tax=Iodobacter sp. CM08 TaxID=3085902 RepID=UPI0029827648|nr:restriction endonuclease subunit S [Iodobacter sp. CM08]MDW5416885.1 restriction endonuclease subunit S [Iodobacter sp. CM08]